MRLINLLFGTKKSKFTPLPDNCPSGVSMRFMSYPPPEYESLPPSFLYYEFGPNCGESNPVAIELSKQIIEVLCQSQKVLTVVQAHKEFDGKGKEVPSLFIRHYISMLEREPVETSVYQAAKTKLAYLTTGYDKKLLPAYYAFPNSVMCDFSFYLFPDTEQLLDARHALEKATTHQYSFRADYIDHGPVALSAYVNHSARNVEYICNAIEQVCVQKNILLINSPTT